MSDVSDFSYAFHANALALGGVVHNPNRTVVPSLGSIVLAPSGGVGSAVITDYEDDVVEFSTAHSSVYGEMLEPGIFLTEAKVTIENFTLFGRFHVDHMSASVTSRRNVKDAEPEITFHAEYAGVYADNVEYVPQLDVDYFSQYPTYEKFVTAVNADPYRLAQWYGGVARTIETSTAQALRASMLTAITTKSDGLIPSGNVLPVLNFGKVRFADVLLKPGHRRLTLLQFAFDRSAAPRVEAALQLAAMAGLSRDTSSEGGGGTMTVASVEGNGTPIWPRGI